MLKKSSLLLVTLFLSFSLSGCFLRPYQIDIQQGNILTPADAAKIKRGMSSQKVVDILGSPVLKNIYIDNRMVYIYTLQLGHKKMKMRRLVVYFVGGRVTNIRTDVLAKPTLQYRVRSSHFYKNPPA